MPLMTLQSNLSWYGTPGFQAATNVEQTRFNYDSGDLTVAVAPRGFDNAGFQSNAFIPRVSGNAFNINGQGTATRLSQLGEGTKFPIGPEGQIHQFDIKRTGFSLISRYGDTFDNKSLKGLAATYTAASPIDDMYNKFKVRDEVYDPYGYAKTPFILKGIQKDGSSDPERYGINAPSIDVPRGGIITNITRTADDIARIGKFLIRPQGIAFIAKQQLLHLMQPNTEGVLGYPSLNYVTGQKVSNPLNLLATVLGSPIGQRFRKYGITPLDTDPLLPTTYEQIHKRRDQISTAALPVNVTQNRLVLMLGDRDTTFLPTWLTLDSVTGPNSVGGIGATIFSKRIEYDTRRVGTTLRRSIDTDRGRTFSTQYFSITPYTKITDTIDNIDSRKLPTEFIERIQLLDPTAKDSLKSRVDKNDFTAIPQREVNKAASNTGGTEGTITAYKRLSYANIQRIATNRKPGSTTTIDFRTGLDWSNTLEKKYGYKAYGFGTRTNQPDPINNDQSETDLINFLFAPSDGGEDTTEGAIRFRAYIISLSDSFNPSWDEQQDQGRADPKIRYQSFSREISVSFKVVVHSRAELNTVYTKLGNLAKLTYPVYSGGFGGKYVRVTIGDLYKRAPMYVTNISYSWDSETPWEIQSGNQLPLYTDVDISLGWIGEKRPNYTDAKIYG